jgi:hypothetical protein
VETRDREAPFEEERRRDAEGDRTEDDGERGKREALADAPRAERPPEVVRGPFDVEVDLERRQREERGRDAGSRSGEVDEGRDAAEDLSRGARDEEPEEAVEALPPSSPKNVEVRTVTEAASGMNERSEE